MHRYGMTVVRCALIAALSAVATLWPIPSHAAYWESDATEYFLEQQKGIVFYTSCAHGDGMFSILLFPSNGDQGWYAQTAEGHESQLGAVFIEKGKWEAGGFSNLASWHQKERGVPVERMMHLPFTALQKKDFHRIFDVKPTTKCP